MPLCQKRIILDRLLNMIIKIDRANNPERIEDKVEGEILKLQERVSRLNAIHNLFTLYSFR